MTNIDLADLARVIGGIVSAPPAPQALKPMTPNPRPQGSGPRPLDPMDPGSR
ncbi:MAG TPA: hypothetical protein VGG74_14230 [Kofleriaceae bacterium]|jgi:hypothetical protein